MQYNQPISSFLKWAIFFFLRDQCGLLTSAFANLSTRTCRHRHKKGLSTKSAFISNEGFVLTWFFESTSSFTERRDPPVESFLRARVHPQNCPGEPTYESLCPGILHDRELLRYSKTMHYSLACLIPTRDELLAEKKVGECKASRSLSHLTNVLICLDLYPA